MGTMIDSSVLIPFFDGDHKNHEIAKKKIEKVLGTECFVNPIILLEISHYFVHRTKMRRYFEIVNIVLKNFAMIEITLEDYLDAILYILPGYKDKVGARDSIIIKNCIDYGLSLLTLDENLKEVANDTGIEVL